MSAVIKKVSHEQQVDSQISDERSNQEINIEEESTDKETKKKRRNRRRSLAHERVDANDVVRRKTSPCPIPPQDRRLSIFSRIRQIQPIHVVSVVVVVGLALFVPWHWLSRFSPVTRSSQQMAPFVIGSARLIEQSGFKVAFSKPGDDEPVLLGDLGLDPKTRTSSKLCKGKDGQKSVSCKWMVGTKLRMSQLQTASSKLQCTRHVWRASRSTELLKDCFHLGNARWYGGGEYFFESWSIDNVSQAEAAFITGDAMHNPSVPYRNVEERFWLSSKGVVIYVSPYVPLFVSINKQKKGWLCLVAKNSAPYSKIKKKPKLTYTVCIGEDMVSTYQKATKFLFKHPRRMPDRKMLKHPIWATGAKFGKHVTQDNVTSFALAIVRHQFPYSLMEIDGQWEDCPGDLTFDYYSFPNPSALVQALDFLQFRVSLRVHPFCNINCQTFARAKREGRWVIDTTGEPTIIEWWNGVGAMLDVTNSSTSLWWTKRLRQLQMDYAVHSFKFDGGEASWVPADAILAAPQRLQPNAYSTKYAQIAARFGKWASVRVAHRSHTLPILVRLLDQSLPSNSDSNDYLRVLIPTVLHCSLLGYPFMAPDAIASKSRKILPDREVYVRWMQVSAFLPAMRFSIPPWDYDSEVVDLAHRIVALHQKYAPYVSSLAEDATKEGTPIIRPLWWISPQDEIAQAQDSEFLVGDELLVAPVVSRGMRHRDIYLPQGVWQDEMQGGIIKGPAWLWNYQAQLHEVPHFTRLGKYLR